MILCYVVVNRKVEAPKKRTVHKRNYNNIDHVKLAQDVINTEFTGVTVDEKFLDFTNKHLKLFDYHCPIKRYTFAPKQNPKFLNPGTKSLIIHKNLLKNLPRDKITPEITNNYKIMKKQVNNFVIRDTKNRLNSYVERSGAWGIMKSLYNKPIHISPPCCPNEFNDYFCSITNTIPNLKINLIKPCNFADVKCVFEFHSVTKTEFFNVWKSVKHKDKTNADFNNISMKMLNYTIGCPSVHDRLIDMINDSFETHTFPRDFKTSIVHPIAKIKNAKEAKDFRPISIQTNLSKLFEKCAYSQLSNFLHKNNLLYNGQFGFRPNHSTEHALLALTQHIYSELNEGKFCAVVTLDLSKAFD